MAALSCPRIWLVGAHWPAVVWLADELNAALSRQGPDRRVHAVRPDELLLPDGTQPQLVILLSSAEMAAHQTEESLIRARLMALNLTFSIVMGAPDVQRQSALLAAEHALSAAQRATENAGRPTWRWMCEKCDDGECEQHWLPRPDDV